jgi:PIN domain nuclease of toxin-antitoxin system
LAKFDINNDGKADFSISVPQIITILAMFASIVGSYYTLNARVDAVETAAKKLKENEQKYTWPNQRKTEEEVRILEIELKAFMKDIEYLRRDVDTKRR